MILWAPRRRRTCSIARPSLELTELAAPSRTVATPIGSPGPVTTRTGIATRRPARTSSGARTRSCGAGAGVKVSSVGCG